MTHTELQNMVVQLAVIMGWRHLHVRRSIGKGHRWQTTTNVVGWPDLLLWHPDQPGRHLAVELKVPPDRLTSAQADVLEDLTAAGFETYVWTPADLDGLPGLLDKRRTRYRMTEAEWHGVARPVGTWPP